MEMLNAENVTALICWIADHIIAQEQVLCELDSVVGDGDHGVTMSRGFKAAKDAVQKQDGSISAQFSAAGHALMTSMGGAIGPIYGTLFDSFSKETVDCAQIGLEQLDRMFAKGLKMVKLVADVKEGQKTVIDSLSPAAASLSRSAQEQLPLREALACAADCADEGAKATIDMIAQKGRARFLREQSRGHQDAGASSMAMIIRSMGTFLDNRKENEALE